MSEEIFNQYAPYIQNFIYKKNWTKLREIQTKTATTVFNTNHHIIIASGTASGKTEAAFFPILTTIFYNPPASIGILYIGPLRALINDQFERLSELLTEGNVPVHSWHGEISQSLKKKAIRTNAGVLQITPESLEMMINSHPKQVEKIFSDLRYIVVDEVHALLGTERGGHLAALLTRLERCAKVKPRRIGLSATLNKDTHAKISELFAPNNEPVTFLRGDSADREVILEIENFTPPPKVDKDNENPEPSQLSWEIYERCYQNRSIIFTNSRSDAEHTISELKKIAQKIKQPDTFLVHHGSIAAELRKDAERTMKESTGPKTVAATLTLELGIDIGDLDFVIQKGAPFSCSSFLQRIGRAGRRTNTSRMFFYHEHETPQGQLKTLPWDMLKSIAITQLNLEEKWVEEVKPLKKPFSLLTHQTLSTLKEHVELTPPELARKVLTLPPFNNITQDEYRTLLQHLIQQDILQKTETNSLIIGLTGEPIVNHYSFCAVFDTKKEYDVIFQGKKIGTLEKKLKPGEKFTLSGQSWKVVHLQKNTVHVEPLPHKKIVPWLSSTPIGTDEKIVKKIYKILQEEKKYPHLCPNAQKLLEESRKTFSLINPYGENLFTQGTQQITLTPQTDSWTQQTITLLLQEVFTENLNIEKVVNYRYYMEIHTKNPTTKTAFIKTLKETLNTITEQEIFIKIQELNKETKTFWEFNKYDNYVPESLLKTAYLHDHLNVKKAQQILNELCEKEKLTNYGTPIT